MSTSDASSDGDGNGAASRTRRATPERGGLGRREDGLVGPIDSATLISGFGALWAALGLVSVGGSRGALLGGVILVVWILVSAPIAYAVAHFGAIPVLPLDGVAVPFVLVEIGLLVMLLGTLRRLPAPIRTLLVSTAALVGLVGLVIASGVADWPIVAQALALVGVGAVVSYTIHRVEYARTTLAEE